MKPSKITGDESEVTEYVLSDFYSSVLTIRSDYDANTHKYIYSTYPPPNR